MRGGGLTFGESSSHLGIFHTSTNMALGMYWQRDAILNELNSLENMWRRSRRVGKEYS